MQACAFGHESVVVNLLEHDLDFTTKQKHGSNIFHYILQGDNIGIYNAVVRFVDVDTVRELLNEPNKSGLTPVHFILTLGAIIASTTHFNK